MTGFDAHAEIIYKKPIHNIDKLISECNALATPGGNTAMAFSDAEVSMCIYGSAQLADQRSRALRECDRNTRRDLRVVSKCRIILENGRVKDTAFVDRFRREARSPVQIEVFGGSTNITTTENGYLIAGKLLSPSLQQVRLVSVKGKELCVGSANIKNQSFTMRCDGIEFKGRVTSGKGLFFYEGRFLISFDVKMNYNTGWIKVKSQLPKGTKLYPF